MPHTRIIELDLPPAPPELINKLSLINAPWQLHSEDSCPDALVVLDTTRQELGKLEWVEGKPLRNTKYFIGKQTLFAQVRR